MRPHIRSWSNRLVSSRYASAQLCRQCQLSSTRYLSTSQAQCEQLQAEPPSSSQPPIDPNQAVTPRQERMVKESGASPIGSRRRRAAIRSTPNLPFQELPYQCFQEALKVLQEDRQQKIKDIEVQRGRIERLKAQDAPDPRSASSKETRLRSMRKHLDDLKVWADVNDPVVKKTFEDGGGDMNRPVYRHLADQKWRSRRRKIIMQRITQMHVVPDLLPKIDVTADVAVHFGRRSVTCGDFVPSKMSEFAPKLSVQVFSRGERLVSVAVVDPDVPNVETDNYDHRCHFLAVNIPLSPTETSIPLAQLSEENQALLPWMPPFAPKGSPYHRLSIFILEHKDGQRLDESAVRDRVKRDGFSLRRFVAGNSLQPVGAYMFRAQWDEGTDEIMQRLGYGGVDTELKAKKVEPLPYRWKPSWSARYR